MYSTIWRVKSNDMFFSPSADAVQFECGATQEEHVGKKPASRDSPPQNDTFGILIDTHEQCLWGQYCSLPHTAPMINIYILHTALPRKTQISNKLSNCPWWRGTSSPLFWYIIQFEMPYNWNTIPRKFPINLIPKKDIFSFFAKWFHFPLR